MTTKLISGLQGEGKTHYAMKLIKKALAEGRPVHTNIDRCTLEGVQDIPQNARGELDWQLCQRADAEEGLKGAFVVYDEAQKIKDNNGKKFFAYVSREKLSPRDVISELDEHRHDGYDIVFITQEVNLLHLHLLSLIKEHYHVSRPFNKKGSQVAFWRSVQKNPNSEAALNRAEDVFFEPFDEKIFTEYKSTEEVTDAKIRIPKYMKKLAIIAAVCILGILGLFLFYDNPFFNIKAMTASTGDEEGIKEMEKYMPKGFSDSKKTVQDTTAALSTGVGAKTAFDPNVECRKGVNVEKKECVDWFNNLSKNGASISPVASLGSDQNVKVSYDPNKPFDDSGILPSISYSVTSKPVFSGCMKTSKGYVAYTEQGTKLNVSARDCRNLIENGDRPYNYFAQNQSSQSQRSVGESVTKTLENSSL